LLNQQRNNGRIVARVEELAWKIEKARSLRQQALEETKILIHSLALPIKNVPTKTLPYFINFAATAPTTKPPYQKPV
jgi:hypothetical protein